jgi:hypothetical protein
VSPVPLHYSVRHANYEGNYTVKLVEFADAQGVIRQARNTIPIWSLDLSLRPGDRIYVRAEIEFEGILWSAIQISGPDGFYLKSECTRLDGPGTCVLEIDRILE